MENNIIVTRGSESISDIYKRCHDIIEGNSEVVIIHHVKHLINHAYADYKYIETVSTQLIKDIVDKNINEK